MKNAFTAHLAADELKGTKEYQVKQLMDILQMIARETDRIDRLLDDCKTWYGINPETKSVRCTPTDKHKFTIYRMAKERLTKYYNLKANSLNKF